MTAVSKLPPLTDAEWAERRRLEAIVHAGLGARRPRQAGTRRSDTRPHVVYKMYDGPGFLLYVGISVSGMNRIAAHSGRVWFADVHRIELEHVSDRATALDREAHLIATCAPLHNVAARS